MSSGSDTRGITSTSVIIVVIDVLGGWSMELEVSDYEKARKGKGCFAKNVESHDLVLAQHSTHFKGNCSSTV